MDVSPEDSKNRGKTPSILLVRNCTACTRLLLRDRYELIVAASAASLGIFIACTNTKGKKKILVLCRSSVQWAPLCFLHHSGKKPRNSIPLCSPFP